MKKLITVAAIFGLSLYSFVFIEVTERADARQAFATRWRADSLTNQLERLQLMGPEPYCLAHPTKTLKTKLQQDSILAYMSRMKERDLYEVKYSVTDPKLLAFVDEVIEYKHTKQ